MEPDPLNVQEPTIPIPQPLQGDNPTPDISLTADAGGVLEVPVQQSVPTYEPAPVTQNEIPASVPQISQEGGKSLSVGIIIAVTVVVAVLLAGGGLVYAYFEKIWIFAADLYTEDTFLSSLLEKSSTIESVHYVSTGTFAIREREEGAEPFSIKVTNETELLEQYQADAERAADISRLLSLLSYRYGTSTYDSAYAFTGVPGDKKPPYPKTLEQLAAADKKQVGEVLAPLADKYSIHDPVTQKSYGYRVTKGGSDFELSVTFALPASVQSVKKRYGFAATTTLINGQTVTFTKASLGVYLNSTPPKPWLVELSEMFRHLPPEMAMSFSMAAQVQLQTDTPTDWTFNVDASGDFGDLIYKVNADALKTGDTYYFRINNMPSLFMTEYAALKGVWVAISPTAASTTNPEGAAYYEKNSFSYLSDNFKEWEEDVKLNRKEMTDMILDLANLADAMKLLAFIQPPVRDTYAGEKAYRYDLRVRKEAIVPFVKAMLEEASVKKRSEPWRSAFVDDQGLLDYLESEEFDLVFDYLSKNISYSIWVNDAGYAVGARYTLRVVPPDTALQLKDKQIEIVFDAALSKINEPFTVSKPVDTKPIEELFEELNANLFEARTKGQQAAQKANLAMVRVSAELAYDKNGGYGKSAFPLGPCAQTPNTLFADSDIVRDLTSATKGKISTATCVSIKSGSIVSAYAVSVPLESDPEFSWCVDSSGRSVQIRGAITEAKCSL